MHRQIQFKTTTPPVRDSIRSLPLRRAFFLIPLVLACFGLSPIAQAEGLSEDDNALWAVLPLPVVLLIEHFQTAETHASDGLAMLDVDYASGRVTEVHILKSTGYPKRDAEAQKRFLRWRIKPHTTRHVKVPITVATTGQKY